MAGLSPNCGWMVAALSEKVIETSVTGAGLRLLDRYRGW